MTLDYKTEQNAYYNKGYNKSYIIDGEEWPIINFFGLDNTAEYGYYFDWNELIIFGTINDNGKVINAQPNKIIKLDENSINELIQEKNNLKYCVIENFPNLQKEILELKNNFLINGNGFFIIDGNSFLDFDDEQVKEIYRLISTGLGELYVQNIKKEKFVIITDEGKSMSTGGRYHQTKEGGSFHTDSPQWSKVPDFVGLFCVLGQVSGRELGVSSFRLHRKAGGGTKGLQGRRVSAPGF